MELVLNSGFCEMSKNETMETDGGLATINPKIFIEAIGAIYAAGYALGKFMAHKENNAKTERIPGVVYVEAIPIDEWL